VATSEMVTRLILSRCFRSAGWAPTCHRNLSIQMRHCHAVFAQRWFVTGMGELVYELVGKLVTPGFTDSRVRVVTVTYDGAAQPAPRALTALARLAPGGRSPDTSLYAPRLRTSLYAPRLRRRSSGSSTVIKH
jgi:hypothetical protein